MIIFSSKLELMSHIFPRKAPQCAFWYRERRFVCIYFCVSLLVFSISNTDNNYDVVITFSRSRLPHTRRTVNRASSVSVTRISEPFRRDKRRWTSPKIRFCRDYLCDFLPSTLDRIVLIVTANISFCDRPSVLRYVEHVMLVTV